MSVSKRKLEANRANAQKSTGPATPEAKEKVAQNSIRHGLTGKFTVLANEPQDLYEILSNATSKPKSPSTIHASLATPPSMLP